MATALVKQDSSERTKCSEQSLRTELGAVRLSHDDKPPVSPLQQGPQPTGRHRLANSFGQADFARLFESSKLDSHAEEGNDFDMADADKANEHKTSTKHSRSNSHSFSGNRHSPRFTGGDLKSCSSSDLRNFFPFTATDISGRALLSGDSFSSLNRRGSLGLSGFGGDSPTAGLSAVPMPAMLQRAHFAATRDQLMLSDMGEGTGSPVSPSGLSTSRRLAELYGFFRQGSSSRTSIEGQDEVLAQVAAEANGDFDLGNPAELREVLCPSSSAAATSLPALSAALGQHNLPEVLMVSPTTPPQLSPIIDRSTILARTLRPVQIVLSQPEQEALPPTPPLLRLPDRFMHSAPPSPPFSSSTSYRHSVLPTDIGEFSCMLPMPGRCDTTDVSRHTPTGTRGGVSKHRPLTGSASHSISPGMVSMDIDGEAKVSRSTASAPPPAKSATKAKPKGERRPRRMTCNHCRTHVTPQWRCGPDGPRTLCNACGVRWGKGKLEAREAVSAKQ